MGVIKIGAQITEGGGILKLGLPGVSNLKLGLKLPGVKIAL